MFPEHTPPAPDMILLSHPWFFSPLRTMDSDHPGSMLLEHLFGPAVDVFFVSRSSSRFNPGTHSTVAGIPSSFPTEATLLSR